MFSSDLYSTFINPSSLSVLSPKHHISYNYKKLRLVLIMFKSGFLMVCLFDRVSFIGNLFFSDLVESSEIRKATVLYQISFMYSICNVPLVFYDHFSIIGIWDFSSLKSPNPISILFDCGSAVVWSNLAGDAANGVVQLEFAGNIAYEFVHLCVRDEFLMYTSLNEGSGLFFDVVTMLKVVIPGSTLLCHNGVTLNLVVVRGVLYYVLVEQRAVSSEKLAAHSSGAMSDVEFRNDIYSVDMSSGMTWFDGNQFDGKTLKLYLLAESRFQGIRIPMLMTTCQFVRVLPYLLISSIYYDESSYNSVIEKECLLFVIMFLRSMSCVLVAPLRVRLSDTNGVILITERDLYVAIRRNEFVCIRVSKVFDGLTHRINSEWLGSFVVLTTEQRFKDYNNLLVVSHLTDGIRVAHYKLLAGLGMLKIMDTLRSMKFGSEGLRIVPKEKNDGKFENFVIGACYFNMTGNGKELESKMLMQSLLDMGGPGYKFFKYELVICRWIWASFECNLKDFSLMGIRTRFILQLLIWRLNRGDLNLEKGLENNEIDGGQATIREQPVMTSGQDEDVFCLVGVGVIYVCTWGILLMMDVTTRGCDQPVILEASKKSKVFVMLPRKSAMPNENWYYMYHAQSTSLVDVAKEATGFVHLVSFGLLIIFRLDVCCMVENWRGVMRCECQYVNGIGQSCGPGIIAGNKIWCQITHGGAERVKGIGTGWVILFYGVEMLIVQEGIQVLVPLYVVNQMVFEDVLVKTSLWMGSTRKMMAWSMKKDGSVRTFAMRDVMPIWHRYDPVF